MDDSQLLTRTKATFQPNKSPNQVAASYNEWADIYDQMLQDGRYNAHRQAAAAIAAVVPEGQQGKVRVLDVAAGTGGVGVELHNRGFQHIDALEPSSGMMEQLVKKGVYTDKYQEFIGHGKSTVPADTYDVVVVSGGMGESHIPTRGINQLIQFAKPGGVVIIVMRHEWLNNTEEYKSTLEPHLQQLNEKGVWKQVSRSLAPNYFYEKEGLVLTFRVAQPKKACVPSPALGEQKH